MELLLKTFSGAIITVILVTILSKQNKEMAVVAVTVACGMIALAAMQYLEPVVAYFDRLSVISELDPQVIESLVKSVGIVLLAEITGHICADAGNAALGKTIQLLATAAVLWLSLPLFSKLMELIEQALVNT